MLITSSLSPASGQLCEDVVAFSYLSNDEVSCHFITDGNDFDYVVPESSHTVEIQCVSEDVDDRKPFAFSSGSEERIADVDADSQQHVEDNVTDASEDGSAKITLNSDEGELNEANTCKCSHLSEMESESSSEEDLTNLTWLQNITNIMSVPSLVVPPAAPKPVPKVHKSRLYKLNQTLSKCQEDFLTNLHEYQTKGDNRPPYSYNTLICLAMRYNNNKMTLAAIYSWIKDNFRYFRNADPSWQNAIRHNLSLNEVFVKVARSKQERGKGGFWKLELARLQDCQICRRGEPLKYQRKKRKAQPVELSPKKEKDADAVSKSPSSDLLLANTAIANDPRQRPGIHDNDNLQDFSLSGFSFDANVVGANVVVEPALPPPLIPEEDLSGLLVVPCDWEDLQLEMLDSFIDSCFK